MSTLAEIYNNQKSSDVSRTDRGTKIVKAGSDMDKNAFLKILSAQLCNQDPTQNVDSTQYVTQLAQFTTMEQLHNLNSTMTDQAHYSLVGKGCTVRATDSNGIPYTGIIQSISKSGTTTNIHMIVNENNENIEKTFDIADIISVVTVPDYSLSGITSINGNTSFLLGTSFIGKNVELSDKDSSNNYLTGNVWGVIKENGVIKARVKLDSTKEIISVTMDKITKVGDFDGKNSSTSESKEES